MNRTMPLGLALAAAVAVAASACGGVVAGTPSAAPAVSPVAVDSPIAAPPTDAPAPPATAAPGSNLDAAAEGLRPFLIDAADVGPGFTIGERPRPDPTATAVCGGPGVVARFPHAVRVATAFDTPGGEGRVQERVSVYADTTTAQAAYDAGAAGLACCGGRSRVNRSSSLPPRT